MRLKGHEKAGVLQSRKIGNIRWAWRMAPHTGKLHHNYFQRRCSRNAWQYLLVSHLVWDESVGPWCPLESGLQIARFFCRSTTALLLESMTGQECLKDSSCQRILRPSHFCPLGGYQMQTRYLWMIWNTYTLFLMIICPSASWLADLRLSPGAINWFVKNTLAFIMKSEKVCRDITFVRSLTPQLYSAVQMPHKSQITFNWAICKLHSATVKLAILRRKSQLTEV